MLCVCSKSGPITFRLLFTSIVCGVTLWGRIRDKDMPLLQNVLGNCLWEVNPWYRHVKKQSRKEAAVMELIARLASAPLPALCTKHRCSYTFCLPGQYFMAANCFPFSVECPEQKGSEPWQATGMKNNQKDPWSSDCGAINRNAGFANIPGTDEELLGEKGKSNISTCNRADGCQQY